MGERCLFDRQKYDNSLIFLFFILTFLSQLVSIQIKLRFINLRLKFYISSFELRTFTIIDTTSLRIQVLGLKVTSLLKVLEKSKA
jgi:hypothetical protein